MIDYETAKQLILVGKLAERLNWDAQDTTKSGYYKTILDQIDPELLEPYKNKQFHYAGYCACASTFSKG